MAEQFGLPKSARLLKTDEFDRVFRYRASAAGRSIIVYCAPGPSLLPRLGLAVSRKYGNAVARNQWKRRLREAFRLVRDELPRGRDIVVLPRGRDAPRVPDLQRELADLTTRIEIRLQQQRADEDPAP